MPNISVFKKATDPKPSGAMDFESYLSGIREGQWQDEVLEFRTGRREKINLPCVTPSGVFTDKRSIKNLEKHTGIINIDIDQKNNIQNVIEAREVIYADPHVYAAHISVSGNGLSLYIKINPEKHTACFSPIQRYFANTYQIAIDNSCKDVSRLRFVSYDPELHMNPRAKKWTETLKKEEIAAQQQQFTHSIDDVDFVMDQITSRRVDIAPSYHDWLLVGFALSDKYGEGGRGRFHTISQYHETYNQAKCDKQYDHCLKSGKSGISMNTFFYLAKQAGLTIVTPKTKLIEKAAKLSKKQVGKSGGFKNEIEAKSNAMKVLNDIEGITPAESEEVINQVFSTQDKATDKNEKDENLDLVFAYIDGLGIRHNEITQRAEFNSQDMTDISINSIYINAISIFGAKLSKQIIVDYIYSDRIPSYNPFIEFFEKNKHLKPKGEVKKLIDTISGEMRAVGGGVITDYNHYFIEKWLLSIISSAHGTYSLMILVLSGKQASGKTKWFRGLLPEELRRYYAESKLDEGKDDQINMCTHLILCDDEYGGKSKQEAKKLKDLSSKQKFTVRRPYGRISEDLNRVAVLCGTSNETDVINDITGNRRVIPVNVESIDFEAYDKIDKTKVFMELYHLWKETGDGWMLTAEDIHILNESTHEYTESSTEAELLISHYHPPEYTSSEKYTPTEIRQYLESLSGIKNISQRRIGLELKKMGYKMTIERIGKAVFRFWNVTKITNYEPQQPF